jgi:hypothetical protein
MDIERCAVAVWILADSMAWACIGYAVDHNSRVLTTCHKAYWFYFTRHGRGAGGIV